MFLNVGVLNTLKAISFCFFMQCFKKSEFGWVVKQFVPFSIKGSCMLCLMEKQDILLETEMSYLALSENLNKISEIVILVRNSEKERSTHHKPKDIMS